MQCNHAVGGVPVGHALVDKGIDQHFADLRPLRAVDVQPFALADGAGAVVAAQTQIGRAVQAAKALAQRLHHVGAAVFQADKGAQIQIDAALPFVEQAGKKTARGGGGSGTAVPVQVDFDFAEVRTAFFQTQLRPCLIQRNFAQIDFRRLRCRRSTRRAGGRGAVVGNFHAEMLRQRLKPAVKSLGNETEFPRAVAAVAFAQNQRGFAAAGQFDRTIQADGAVFQHFDAQTAQRRSGHGGGKGKGNALDGRRLTRQSSLKTALAAAGGKFQAAVVTGGLAVKHHIAVAAYFAVGGQAVGGNVDFTGAADADGNIGGTQGGIGAGGKDLAHLVSPIQIRRRLFQAV